MRLAARGLGGEAKLTATVRAEALSDARLAVLEQPLHAPRAQGAVHACVAAVGLAMLLVLVDVAVLARRSQRLAAREKRPKSE